MHIAKRREPAYRLFHPENSEALPNTADALSWILSKNRQNGPAFALLLSARSAQKDGNPLHSQLMLEHCTPAETYLIASETGS
jgi:hypothetical protein